MSPSDRSRTHRTSALASVADALCAAHTDLLAGRDAHHRLLLPNREVLVNLVAQLRSVLFPGYFSEWDLSAESLHFYIGATLDQVVHTLHDQVTRGLCLQCADPRTETCECEDSAWRISRSFLERLPVIRELLATDVQAAYEGDPAATSLGEIIFSYPGLQAIIAYRIAHELHLLGAPLIPRIITEHAHSVTGIDIHPGAHIGSHFFIDHGTGVVIGETCIIGKYVRIYQGVTLGAKSFPLDENGKPIKGIPRHPIVEDGVIIYAGATVLGRITLGAGSSVGGNVWLTKSVPPGTAVTQSKATTNVFEEGAGI